MLTVLLDTNILHQEGLESAQMQILSRLVEAGKVEVILPELVGLEYRSRKSLETKDDLLGIIKKTESLKKKRIFNIGDSEEIEKMQVIIKSLQNTVDDSVEGVFNKWVEKLRVNIVPIDSSHSKSVFADYFLGKGAFNKPKNREDIPDAFILESIKEILGGLDSLYVIVKDGNFRKAIHLIDKTKTCAELQDLFELKEFKEELKELDSDSERIKEITKCLNTDDTRKILDSFINFQKEYLSEIFLIGEEITDPSNIIDIKIWGEAIESININNITDVSYKNSRYIGDEIYIINVTVKAKVDITYVAHYGDFNSLDPDRVDGINFLSMNGDGICELMEGVICDFFGSITLTMDEKIDPKELSSHLNHLGREKSLISSYMELKRAVIISLEG